MSNYELKKSSSTRLPTRRKSGTKNEGGSAAKDAAGRRSHAKYGDMLVVMRKDFYQRYDNKAKSSTLGLEKFQRLTILGEGSFGRVLLIYHSESGNYYAMKVFEKAKVMKLKQLEHTILEKRILEAVRFPYIVNLINSFKDNSYLYLVMPFLQGGDMFIHLRRMVKFDENLSRFYGSQVLLALEYLHFCDILYRDLKPENILLDRKGNLKLADLGFCKVVKGRTWTLCGTPEYIAPEIILSKGYGKAVDWWSYGILLFEMNAGHSPFDARDPMRIYEKIVTGKYKNPPHFSLPLMDLVKNLLQVDLSRRFGNLKSGTMDIKDHKWFRGIDWIDIYNGKMEPPFVPEIKNDNDVGNFETVNAPPLKIASTELFRKEFDSF